MLPDHLLLQFIQFLGQIDVVALGVLEPESLFPQGFHLLPAVLLDGFDVRGIVDFFAVVEEADLQVAGREVLQFLLLPHGLRIEEDVPVAGRRRFVADRQQVGDGLSVFVVVEPVDFLIARVGDLFDVFGDLDFRDEFAVLFDGHQLVDAAEYRLGLGCDETLADAEGVDLRTFHDHIPDQVFVQGVGNGDGAVFETCLVQHFPGLFRQIGDIAAVDADALGFRVQLPEYPDGIRDAGFQHIIGIHQQDAVVRIEFRILAEGIILRREHLNPAVGHGAQCRDAALSVGDGAGGAAAPADVGRPGAVDGCGGAVGSAGAEFHDRPALGRPGNAAGFCRDQTLMVHGEQDHGLQKLGLDDRTPHCHQRFMREDRCAFRDGPDVTGEFEILQVVQEGLAEDALAPEIGNILIGKFQVFQVIDDLVDAGQDGVAPPIRDLPEKHIEISDLVRHAGFEIAISHGQFVEIGQHGQILFH